MKASTAHAGNSSGSGSEADDDVPATEFVSGSEFSDNGPPPQLSPYGDAEAQEQSDGKSETGGGK